MKEEFSFRDVTHQRIGLAKSATWKSDVIVHGCVLFESL